MKRKGGGRGGRSERMAMVKMMRARGGAIDGEIKGEGASEGGSERGRRMDVGTEGEMKRGRQKVIKLDESGATGVIERGQGARGLGQILDGQGCGQAVTLGLSEIKRDFFMGRVE